MSYMYFPKEMGTNVYSLEVGHCDKPRYDPTHWIYVDQ